MKKSDGTTDWVAIIMWAIIICLVGVGVYKMGAKSNHALTPQEQQEEDANCRRWTGKNCEPYSAN
jgi:hypothetical protein